MTDDLQQARVAAFKAAWEQADSEGDVGNRVVRGLAAADAIQSKAKSSQNFVLPSVERVAEVIARELDMPLSSRLVLAHAIHALFGEVAGDE